MKELQERIEECLARLKELPALIRAEREKMNGKAAIEELKTRLKGLWLGYIADATMMHKNHKSGEKPVKLHSNSEAREGYALLQSQTDDEYGLISEEIKRYEHQRNTASMNHEALVKEHSGLISTVDVLREMLVVELYGVRQTQVTLNQVTKVAVQRATAAAEAKTMKEMIDLQAEVDDKVNKKQEASNEEG